MKFVLLFLSSVVFVSGFDFCLKVDEPCVKYCVECGPGEVPGAVEGDVVSCFNDNQGVVLKELCKF